MNDTARFCAYDADDDTEIKEEGEICPQCNGSGEGMYDGSTCSACKGKGEC